MSNENSRVGRHAKSDEYYEIVPEIAKVHPSVLPTIVKATLGFIAFLAVGYYTLWMSANYVKKDTFDDYTKKQDQLLSARFDILQSKLENILNQQIITSEQFKNLNLILNNQQKSLDTLNERLTFLERNYFKSIKDQTNENKN